MILCDLNGQEIILRAFFDSRSHLFDYTSLLGRPANENLSHAFEIGSREFGLSTLLDPEGKNSRFLASNQCLRTTVLTGFGALLGIYNGYTFLDFFSFFLIWFASIVFLLTSLHYPS